MDTLPEMLSMLLDGAVDVLDISEDLREAAVSAYEEVGAWLADHGNPGCRVYPQGSFLLGTVVRPATPGGEYDIDLVIWLLLARESITQNELKDRIGVLLDEYRKWKADQGHTDGPDSLESRRRCWTLGYTGFHLDVLPAIPDDEHPPNGILLTDENLFRWQHSNPIGYADWFKTRSETTRLLLAKRHESVADVPTWRTRTPLQRVVQILKWHCMITFADDLDCRPPSILLTTLAGRAYDGEPDLFTAVRIVVDNMTRFVERRGDKWWVPNPAHEEENFTDKWNDYPERRKAFYRWYDQIRATMNDLAALEGKGLDAVYGRLAETFDREPVMKSYQRYAAEMSRRELRMGATGLLTASASSTGRRVPQHTFHGHGHLPRG
jgi:hypothetical protein